MSFKWSIQNNSELLFAEYYPGGIISLHMRANPTLKQDKQFLQCFFAWLLKNLLALHNKRLLHFDIHEDNIVIDKTGKPRFIDFGMVRIHKKEKFNEDKFAHESCIDFQGIYSVAVGMIHINVENAIPFLEGLENASYKTYQGKHSKIIT